MAGDWAKSTLQAKLHHELLCLLCSAVIYGISLPDQLIRVCLPQWPGSDQPKTEWACLVWNTWWHQRLEFAHSPLARVRQAFGTSLSTVCSFTLSICSFTTFSTGKSRGLASLLCTHTPNIYYYRHIYTSNMSNGQLCSPTPILTSASVYNHDHSTITTIMLIIMKHHTINRDSAGHVCRHTLVPRLHWTHVTYKHDYQ